MEKVRFHLDREDFDRLQTIVNNRVRKSVGTFTLPTLVQVLTWMFLTLPLFSLFRIWQDDPEAARPLVFLAASLVVSFFLAAFAVPWASKRTLTQYSLSGNGTFFEEQSISLFDVGIALETANASSRMKWKGFIDRYEDDKNHYLFVDALQALVVPKSVATSLGSDFASGMQNIRSAV